MNIDPNLFQLAEHSCDNMMIKCAQFSVDFSKIQFLVLCKESTFNFVNYSISKAREVNPIWRKYTSQYNENSNY